LGSIVINTQKSDRTNLFLEMINWANHHSITSQRCKAWNYSSGFLHFFHLL